MEHLSLVKSSSLEADNRAGRISEMYVTPNHRRQAVAFGLLDAIPRYLLWVPFKRSVSTRSRSASSGVNAMIRSMIIRT